MSWRYKRKWRCKIVHLFWILVYSWRNYVIHTFISRFMLNYWNGLSWILIITIFWIFFGMNIQTTKALSYGAIVSCTWKGLNICLLQWSGRFSIAFLGVLDVDIVYCGQFLSYHVVKHPFEISILHTPLIFKHAMPFFNKGNDHSWVHCLCNLHPLGCGLKLVLWVYNVQNNIFLSLCPYESHDLLEFLVGLVGTLDLYDINGQITSWYFRLFFLFFTNVWATPLLLHGNWFINVIATCIVPWTPIK